MYINITKHSSNAFEQHTYIYTDSHIHTHNVRRENIWKSKYTLIGSNISVIT